MILQNQCDAPTFDFLSDFNSYVLLYFSKVEKLPFPNALSAWLADGFINELHCSWLGQEISALPANVLEFSKLFLYAYIPGSLIREGQGSLVTISPNRLQV